MRAPLSAMSSRQNFQSRDIDEVPLDVRPHARFHRIDGDEIDALAEQALEEELEVHVAIERRRTRELDEHVDIAPLAELIARGGAKQGERLDREPPLQLLDIAAQRAEYLGSVHSRVSFMSPLKQCTRGTVPGNPFAIHPYHIVAGDASFSIHADVGAVVLAHPHLHAAEVDDEG